MKNTPKYGDEIDRWEETMYLYESALKTMTMKAEMMNDEFVHRYRYNPIEHIKSRLKSADSIVRKLKQDGYDVTIENMCADYLLLYLGHLSDCGDDKGAGGYYRALCQGLHPPSQAQWL